MTRGLRWLALAGLCLAAACTTQYRNHGYVPGAQELARLDIGDSREEVSTVIGTPSATGVLTDEAWFYVRSRWRDYAWRPPVEIDREVMVVSFRGDAVSNVERYGLRDGRVVVLSRRVTESETSGVPFLQQLFGNLGTFNPADYLGGNN